MSRTSRFFVPLLFFLVVFVTTLAVELVLPALAPQIPRLFMEVTAALVGALTAVFLLTLLLLKPLGKLSSYSQRIFVEKDFSNTSVLIHSRTLAGLAKSIFDVNSYIQALFLLMKDNINSAIETSELLSMHADFGKDRTTEVDGFLKNIREEFNVLETSVNRVEKAFAEVTQRITSLNTCIVEQDSAVSEDTLTINALIQKLHESAKLAKEKRAATTELNTVVTEGGSKLKSTVDLVRSIEADAGHMLELIAVIDDIAERTNILSINASIQAARSGEAGKGFSVVAKEIRNLAENARHNSDDIATTLNATISKIKAAAVSAKQVEQSFSEIYEETMSVSNAFDTIDHSMTNLVDAGNNSLAIVERVSDSTTQMKTEYSQIALQTNDAGLAIHAMHDSYSTLSSQTSEIEKNVKDLTIINNSLFNLGTANEDRLNQVTREIMNLKTFTGEIRLTLPAEPNDAHEYYHELLKTALEEIGMHCAITVTEPLPQNEILRGLDSGDLDAYWLVQTRERDQTYVPVKVVLSRGLVGKRVLFIPKNRQQDFDVVNSLNDFRRLKKTGGFGKGWFDVKVWQENGLLTFEQEGDWRLLFDRLQEQKGVDYISRGANEIVMEAPMHPELAIEKRLLFVYIRNLRYYLSKKASGLCPILENAIRYSLYSGLMDRLMRKYFPGVFSKEGLDLDNRIKIKLVV